MKGIKVYTYCFNGISEISILTQKTDEGEMFLPLNHDYSRLFYAFPLLGTEDIGIPFLINSIKFDPCVERDGVYLTSGEKEVLLNKKIIADSILDACDVFSSLGANLYIKHIDQLFKFEQSKQHDWIDIAWFTDIKLEAFEILSKKTIIEINGTKKLYSLSDLKIPFSKVATNKTSYWDLLSDLKDFDIPKRDQTANWISIIENTQKLKEKDIIEHESVWILDRFISTFIEKYDHSDQLKTDLKTESVYDWVNSLYNLIIKEKGTFPLDIKILLNENNFFCVADGMLWDEIKDASLINIAENLAIGFKEKLISNSINKFNINGVASFLQEDAIQKLLNKINDLKSSDFIENEKLMESNAFFLQWLIIHNKESELPELKVLRKGSIPYDEEYIYERFSKSSILLSPNSYFATDYPLYSTLIRPKDCMAEIYYTILADEDFKYLAKQELIRLTPLMLIQKTNPSVRTIEQLIMDKSQLPLIIEDGKIREDLSIDLEYSDFTYLTATDGYIYSRNTTQQSTLERFRFLLKEAPEKDPFFEDNEQQIIIEANKIIKFYKCLWIVRAKQLQWVNIPMLDEETNKTIFIKESPNSNNLSELLKKDESLKNSIRQIKQQKFLNLLNVGVSDMMRNTLATDELKLEWDKAITSMIASGNNPELVQEIFNNPQIQQEYNNKLKQRKLIERNQGIGYLLEKLFKEYIEILCKGKQVDIKRKPFGSDYIITEESSDLVNDNGEHEIFVIGDCLVELKATGRDYASMTTLQAHTAAENIERYVLIVLPLDGNTPDIEYVRNNARVISDIGDRVKSLVNSYDKLEEDRDELDIGVDGVSVNIEDKNVRFRVDADIWNSSKMYIEDFMKKYFRSY